MELSVGNADRYWNLLKDLSDEMKLDLIARLSNSMRKKNKTEHISAKSICLTQTFASSCCVVNTMWIRR